MWNVMTRSRIPRCTEPLLGEPESQETLDKRIFMTAALLWLPLRDRGIEAIH
jgi:hypothetical protein